jgi:predicted  nucleic acid-binding Zn-ribbon protein
MSTMSLRELNALQRKLDTWELEHLREHTLALRLQLDDAMQRIERLESDLACEEHRADMFMALNTELAERGGLQLGLTQQGDMGVMRPC